MGPGNIFRACVSWIYYLFSLPNFCLQVQWVLHKLRSFRINYEEERWVTKPCSGSLFTIYFKNYRHAASKESLVNLQNSLTLIDLGVWKVCECCCMWLQLAKGRKYEHSGFRTFQAIFCSGINLINIYNSLVYL